MEIPSVESTQWLNLTNCGIVKVKSRSVILAELESKLSVIYCKEWPGQIREMEPGQFLVRFPPHKKVADIKNYPSFNLRKEGVQVELLEWFGDLAPYAVLQDVWVQMKGIPPKWCHWRVFAQIASSFGLMVEVDWSTLFKSFYEVVRVKISCKDISKIPVERLYEMDKKIFIVSFMVEKEDDKKQKGKYTDNGGDDDDDNFDNDDEADDLDDDDDGVEKPPSTEFQIGKSSKMRTPVTKSGLNTGHKTVCLSSSVMELDQEKQLRSLMRGLDVELLTAGESNVLINPGCIDVTCDYIPKPIEELKDMMILEN